MTNEENELFKQLPDNSYVNVKKLWCGDIGVNIEHTGNRHPANPLDYKTAILKMVDLLKKARRTQG